MKKSEIKQPNLSYVNEIFLIECCDINNVIIEHHRNNFNIIYLVSNGLIFFNKGFKNS